MENNNIAEMDTVNTEVETSIIRIDDAIKEEFTVDYEKTQNVNSDRLDKEAVIEVFGNFSPKKPGTSKLVAIFKYNEGEEVETSTEAEVIQVSLSIELVKPSNLSAKFALNSEQEIEFLIKNASGLDATQIKLEAELLEGVTITKEKPDDKGEYVEEDSTISLEDFNQKADNSLDSTHQFRIKGKLKTGEKGEKALSVLVKYDELKTLIGNDLDKAGKKFAKNIEIVEVSIAVAVTKPLPAKIKLGQTADVAFSFTNQSDQFAVTNVKLEITQADQQRNQQTDQKKILRS